MYFVKVKQTGNEMRGNVICFTLKVLYNNRRFATALPKAPVKTKRVSYCCYIVMTPRCLQWQPLLNIVC